MSLSVEDDQSQANYGIFRDVLFNAITEDLSKSNGRRSKRPKKRSIAEDSVANSAAADSSFVNEQDVTTLVDFSDFLTCEIFPSLPPELRTISHQSLQEDISVSEKWSLPLSLDTYEEVCGLIPPTVTDNLQAYGLIMPPASDLHSFIAPVVTAFLRTSTAAPPKWIETRLAACEICERDWVPLTYHHLIPRAVHAKVLKRKWHEERQLNSVAWLCRACHSYVHRIASNVELAQEFYTVERLLDREDIRKFAAWISSVRWKKK